MKILKRVIVGMLLVFMLSAFIACENKTNKGGDTTIISSDLTPSANIKALANLTDYGGKEATYAKTAVTYDSAAKTYAGTDCSAQITKLQERIDAKKTDVINNVSDSSFVKIFAMSTPSGLLGAMAKAALTFDEMNRVVTYLSGTETPKISDYIAESDSGVWSGVFTDGLTKWQTKKNADNTASFNEGWSYFDDLDIYDKLKDYAEDDAAFTGNDADDKKDLAGDNATWQYRSILKKVYTEVKLDGDAAARLATYMLAYAVDIVEEKSGGNVNDAIVTSASVTTYGKFAQYCKTKPASDDPFGGFGDYETLSYLLAFNAYYGDANGLKNCVTLYGYYYDYNETYYTKALADETTYEKQLKYEKMKTFTDAEWLDYVSIQRNNYINTYRYSRDFYEKFYGCHFEFQTIIETYDSKVYQISGVSTTLGIEKPSVTYTDEMKKAITKSGDIDGIEGQLAMSDWLWCYSGKDDNMKAYNGANTQYQNGKDSGKLEDENQGKFYYEMQELKIIDYLFTNMTASELSSALYYQVYAYSASMVNTMQNYVKNIVYVNDEIETGDYYTHIASEVKASDGNTYAVGKITTLYKQAYSDWTTVGVSTKANNATAQPWSGMKTEIETAINYDYMNMTISQTAKDDNGNVLGTWGQRVERLEDLVITRVWSDDGSKVSESSGSNHVVNADGTAAYKKYDTNHQISQFVSEYEDVLYHIAGEITVSFQRPNKSTESTPGGYVTTTQEAAQTWLSGYYGTIKTLRDSKPTNSMNWSEDKAITISGGSAFKDEVDGDDLTWWEKYQTSVNDNLYASITNVESNNGTKVTYVYSYKFTGWYLDKDCMYLFDENDDIGINVYVYAGYDVTKTKSKG
jgi:hypothetical protein